MYNHLKASKKLVIRSTFLFTFVIKSSQYYVLIIFRSLESLGLHAFQIEY